MLAAMAQATRKLSPEDARRNVHHGHLVLRVAGGDRSRSGATFDSLLSEEIDGELFRSRLLRDKQQCIHVYCEMPRHIDPNFPSLARLPFTHEIKRIGVQVRGYHMTQLLVIGCATPSYLVMASFIVKVTWAAFVQLVGFFRLNQLVRVMTEVVTRSITITSPLPP